MVTSRSFDPSVTAVNSDARDAVREPSQNSQWVVDRGHGFRAKLTDGSDKMFLVFDQSSGDEMRLFLSHSIGASSMSVAAAGAKCPYEDGSTSPSQNGKWDENHLTDEGTETGEDTEELNALLVSSDSDGGYSDEDEVTSTGHSPFITEEECSKDEPLDEPIGSDGFRKRRRLLLNKKYGSPPFNLTEDSASGYAAYDYRIEKGAEIRRLLKTLETILPGLNKDHHPLSIFDKAIAYLKSMKAKAKDMGLASPKD